MAYSCGLNADLERSGLLYNTIARHEQHKCNTNNTSATQVTQVRHEQIECNTSNTSVAQLLNKRNEGGVSEKF